MRNVWTEDDLAKLDQLYPTTDPRVLAAEFGRSLKAIYLMADKRGLRRIGPAPYKKRTHTAKYNYKRSSVPGKYPRGTLKERFEAKVQITPGCWIWKAWTRGNGYGGMNDDGRFLMAHRVSYELYVGPIPDGLIIMHKCDNPRCVNPDHLRPGTLSENTLDAIQKGRWVNNRRKKGVPA